MTIYEYMKIIIVGKYPSHKRTKLHDTNVKRCTSISHARTLLTSDADCLHRVSSK